MALSTTPALNTNNIVTLCKDSKFDGLGDTPLKATVDVHLPVLLVEVRLLLREEEGIYTTIQVRVLEASGQHLQQN